MKVNYIQRNALKFFILNPLSMVEPSFFGLRSYSNGFLFSHLTHFNPSLWQPSRIHSMNLLWRKRGLDATISLSSSVRNKMKLGFHHGNEWSIASRANYRPSKYFVMIVCLTLLSIFKLNHLSQIMSVW